MKSHLEKECSEISRSVVVQMGGGKNAKNAKKKELNLRFDQNLSIC